MTDTDFVACIGPPWQGTAQEHGLEGCLDIIGGLSCKMWWGDWAERWQPTLDRLAASSVLAKADWCLTARGTFVRLVGDVKTRFNRIAVPIQEGKAFAPTQADRDADDEFWSELAEDLQGGERSVEVAWPSECNCSGCRSGYLPHFQDNYGYGLGADDDYMECKGYLRNFINVHCFACTCKWCVCDARRSWGLFSDKIETGHWDNAHWAQCPGCDCALTFADGENIGVPIIPAQREFFSSYEARVAYMEKMLGETAMAHNPLLAVALAHKFPAHVENDT